MNKPKVKVVGKVIRKWVILLLVGGVVTVIVVVVTGTPFGVVRWIEMALEALGESVVQAAGLD